MTPRSRKRTESFREGGGRLRRAPGTPRIPLCPALPPCPPHVYPRESVETAGALPPRPACHPAPCILDTTVCCIPWGSLLVLAFQGHPKEGAGSRHVRRRPGAPRILGPWGRPGEPGRKDPAHSDIRVPWSQQEAGSACASQATGSRRAPGTILPASRVSTLSDKGAESWPWVVVKLLLISPEALIKLKVLCLLKERTNKRIHEQTGA